ncbi:hypothetical protein ACFE04_006601 [Oxalis oulophora]
MGSALEELEAKLRSSQVLPLCLTLDESGALANWRGIGFLNFLGGTVFGGTLAFIAIRKLKTPLQFNHEHSKLFSLSPKSKPLEHVIKNTEKVYDDSTSEQPKLRFHHRSYFNDHVVLGQKTHDLADDKNVPNSSPEENSNNSIHKDTALVSRHAPVNAGLSINTDPVNDISSFTETLEESNRTSTSSTQTKVCLFMTFTDLNEWFHLVPEC